MNYGDKEMPDTKNMSFIEVKATTLLNEMPYPENFSKEMIHNPNMLKNLTTQVEKLLKQERISVEECSELINNFSKFHYSSGNDLNTKITQILLKVDYSIVISELRKYQRHSKNLLLERLAPFMLEGFLREKNLMTTKRFYKKI